MMKKEEDKELLDAGNLGSDRQSLGDADDVTHLNVRWGAKLDADVIEVYTMILRLYFSLHKNKKIPIHRKFDICAIRGFLKDDEITHVALFAEMEFMIKGMKTGLIINHQEVIGTGHSRLLAYLRSCLTHPSYNQAGMQRRDDRRARLNEQYEQRCQILSESKLNVFEDLELKNKALVSDLKNCEAALHHQKEKSAEEKEKIKVQNDTIDLLGDCVGESEADTTQTKEALTRVTERLRIVEEENKRLRCARYTLTVPEQKPRSRDGFFGTFFQSSPDVKEGTCLVQDQSKEEESFFNAFLRLFD
jgi:uncharacterized coiled-coil protein SlyX